MSFVSEMGDAKKRLARQIDRLSKLKSKHGVGGYAALVKTYTSNANFRSEWNDIWRDIAVEEGGKLSLGTIGIIIGASFGGVGIAALGGAIGLPLALVLGLGGLVAGTEVDATRHGACKITIEKRLHNKLLVAAESRGGSVEELVAEILETALTDWK